MAIYETKLFSGRVAFITGGASGIGQVTAVAFAREGANVALTYHKRGAEQTAHMIEEFGGRVISCQVRCIAR